MPDHAMYVGTMAHEHDAAYKRLSGLRAARDSAIRRAYRDGVSQAQLSEWSGLTRQRIQQICDLSKETKR